MGESDGLIYWLCCSVLWRSLLGAPKIYDITKNVPVPAVDTTKKVLERRKSIEGECRHDVILICREWRNQKIKDDLKKDGYFVKQSDIVFCTDRDRVASFEMICKNVFNGKADKDEDLVWCMDRKILKSCIVSGSLSISSNALIEKENIYQKDYKQYVANRIERRMNELQKKGGSFDLVYI